MFKLVCNVSETIRQYVVYVGVKNTFLHPGVFLQTGMWGLNITQWVLLC